MPRGIDAKSVTREDTRLLRHYGTKVVSEINYENSNNLRQYEKQQSQLIVIPSDSDGIQPIDNSTQLQGKKNNLTEKNLFTYSPIHLFTLKHAAFTLAEVLITLGIIGVVAALTLPSVIANYQEKQLTTAWKKAYSDAANAALLMSQNNEDLSTEQKTGEAFAKYLQIDKVCEANKGVEQGCWQPNTKIYRKDGIYYDTSPTNYGGGAVCMSLTSGTIFCVDSGSIYSILYFDVNGINKPNTFGKDIFFAIFNKEKYAIRPAKGRLLKWGASDCYWVTCSEDVTCDSDNIGYSCSAEKLLK